MAPGDSRPGNPGREDPTGRASIKPRPIHLRPLVAAADQPPAPVELRRALATIDRVITAYVDNARLGSAA